MMMAVERGHQKFLNLVAEFITMSNDKMSRKYGGVNYDIGRAKGVVEARGR